jgi:hypothetical protein
VPHPEIGKILANGTAADFDYIVQDGDNIAVYPATASPAVSPQIRLRPEMPQPPAFVVDGSLGKLARYLRLLGFDCLYRNDYHDQEVARIANEQQRTLLTRDRALLQRKIIVTAISCARTNPSCKPARRCTDSIYTLGSSHLHVARIATAYWLQSSHIACNRLPGNITTGFCCAGIAIGFTGRAAIASESSICLVNFRPKKNKSTPP